MLLNSGALDQLIETGYRYAVVSNADNLWLDMVKVCAALAERRGVLGLPMICNLKTVGPTDGASPKVVADDRQRVISLVEASADEVHTVIAEAHAASGSSAEQVRRYLVMNLLVGGLSVAGRRWMSSICTGRRFGETARLVLPNCRWSGLLVDEQIADLGEEIVLLDFRRCLSG